MQPEVSGGRVETEFLAAVRRVAGPVRGIGLALISLFGVLSLPDAFLPWGWALAGCVLVAAAADCLLAVTGRTSAAALVPAVLPAALVCGAQHWTGPTPWALNVLTTTAITLQWQWSPKVTAPIIAGLLALSAVGFDGGGATALRVLVESVLARLAFVLLRRSSRRVDELRERRAALERAEALALDRHRREREYLALLHDTAAATFLHVAVHDTSPEEAVGYARRDLAVLTGARGGRDSPVDLHASLRAVVAAAPVAVEARWEPTPLVPARVALALVRAVREALVNVERHAGTGAATLHVRSGGEGVVVTVADEGRGFDPARVAEHRRGVRGSIVERIAAVGGRAVVESRPAGGTSVRLVWPDG